MTNLHKVAIIGRTNVGKSTLYNRLIGKKKAIISPVAGTTRDRNYAICSWRDMDFYLIDTGGLERSYASADSGQLDDMDNKIIAQALLAAEEADLILFVVDSKNGLMPNDLALAKKIKRSGKNILLAANKADNQSLRQSINEFYKLNLGQPWPVSAANGSGSGDLLDEIVDNLKKQKNKKRKKAAEEKSTSIRVAMVGKPNVGKSSLINSILGDNRLIVSPQAHTTRDSQDINFKYQNQLITFIDTAGLRRKSSIAADPFEKQSVEQSLKSIEKSDIVLLVTDASQELSFQDKRLIDETQKMGKGLIILINKWDLVPDKSTDSAHKFTRYYQGFFPFINWAPMIFCSAKEKIRIKKILETILEVHSEKNKFISENALSKLLQQIIKKHKPSRGKGTNHPYIYSLKQLETNPPYFTIKLSFKSSLHESYLRFIENNLRYKFGFIGTPIKIKIIRSQNKYDK
ncbi:MAG: ribosome biogenesis GTPase Der [Patescibacteria group bacterium]|nr:ribosome biogenesis GTPase Der [Patescibacteria group bacterium]